MSISWKFVEDTPGQSVELLAPMLQFDVTSVGVFDTTDARLGRGWDELLRNGLQGGTKTVLSKFSVVLRLSAVVSQL